MLAHKRRYTFIPIPSPPTAKTPAKVPLYLYGQTLPYLLFCFLVVWSIRDKIVGFHDATRTVLLSYIFIMYVLVFYCVFDRMPPRVTPRTRPSQR
jgi:hypothetical protein